MKPIILKARGLPSAPILAEFPEDVIVVTKSRAMITELQRQGVTQEIVTNFKFEPGERTVVVHEGILCCNVRTNFGRKIRYNRGPVHVILRPGEMKLIKAWDLSKALRLRLWKSHREFSDKHITGSRHPVKGFVFNPAPRNVPLLRATLEEHIQRVGL